MCVLGFSLQTHPGYTLIFAGNRDEYFNRPAAAADWWSDAPDVLGGIDLQAGGSWLAISRTGRIAVVTNFREPARAMGSARSRGSLVRDFVTGQDSPSAFVHGVHAQGAHYRGFSLVAGCPGALWYVSNRAEEPRRLAPGIHALSNHLLDTPWPKVRSLSALLATLPPGPPASETLFGHMRDERPAPEDALPDTGVGPVLESGLSATFVRLPGYGTRCTTLITMDQQGEVLFAERSFDADGRIVETRHFDFRLAGAEATAP